MNQTDKHQRLRPVMIAGTGSDVGKSIIATALCRIFKQDGYSPAPFKAQNMSLNSYSTLNGLEIGRAQAVQAEAADVPCSADMNPLLLKPNSDHTSQVVLCGKPIGNQSASQYFRKEGRDFLRKAVCDAFDRLASRYNPIVMEGAGSIAEINLQDVDLVNMNMARAAGASVILVADIDRGGVFASAYGSIVLQNPDDQKRIKGIIVNKFRGDISLFESGVNILEDICGVPVLGVVPYYTGINIEDEDSIALELKKRQSELGKVNVAVVLLKHLSNFTDFNVLERDERVHLFYTDNVDEIDIADIVIVPGSKSTINDLRQLRANGIAQAILKAHSRGATVMGICGGYQMLGRMVCDPQGVEGTPCSMPGLGLLPTVTTMQGDKLTKQTSFTFAGSDAICHGYEIHMGSTVPADDASLSPLCRHSDGRDDGYMASEHCFGTYIHGILDNAAFLDFLLSRFTGKEAEHSQAIDCDTFRNEQYNMLADHVRRHINMDLLYRILSNDD